MVLSDKYAAGFLDGDGSILSSQSTTALESVLCWLFIRKNPMAELSTFLLSGFQVDYETTGLVAVEGLLLMQPVFGLLDRKRSIWCAG